MELGALNPAISAVDSRSKGRRRRVSGHGPETEPLFTMPLSPHERHDAAPQDRIASLFEDASNFSLRYIKTLEQAASLAIELRNRNYKIVLTNGSFDLLHRGHSMYLERARSFGDFLFVGVDSDEKIQERKGPRRPLVPEIERLEMLTYQRSVGAVFLKKPVHRKWALVKHVRPEVLVVTVETYTPAELDVLSSTYGCEVKVLERMASVSTSGRLRAAQIGENERLFELGS